MAKRFNPAQLFERWKARPGPKPVYASDEASLDAVERGAKGMSFFSTVAGALASPNDDLTYWLRLAQERNLVVALHVDTVPKWSLDQQPVRVFLARPEQLWRIPAFLALNETAFADGKWSDSAENLMSHLLGYTPQQRKTWLEQRRQDAPAWTCGTVYTMLSKTQRKLVESVGNRCLGPADAVQGTNLFFHRGGMLKQNVLAKLPRNYSLARFALRWSEVFEIFGTLEQMPRYGLVSRPLTVKLAKSVNAGLQSNIEFLTRAGWR